MQLLHAIDYQGYQRRLLWMENYFIILLFVFCKSNVDKQSLKYIEYID